MNFPVDSQSLRLIAMFICDEVAVRVCECVSTRRRLEVQASVDELARLLVHINGTHDMSVQLRKFVFLVFATFLFSRD